MRLKLHMPASQILRGGNPHLTHVASLASRRGRVEIHREQTPQGRWGFVVEKHDDGEERAATGFLGALKQAALG